MNQSPKYLIKLLEENGFIFKRNTNQRIIVPIHGGKDIKKGTLFAILKQAGIEKY